MDIYILRHGDAGAHLSSKTDDRKRSLTSLGKEEITDVARALKKIGVGIDVIFSSPLNRAYESAVIVSNIFKTKVKVKVLDDLAPEGKRLIVYQQLSKQKEESVILIVGHEPQLGEIISEIIHKDKGNLSNLELKKGGIARLRMLSFKDVPFGELRWLMSPELLKKTNKKRNRR
jgi:phosphohistidine phosphatase